MMRSFSKLAVLALAVCASSPWLHAKPAGEGAADYQFQTPPVNSLGLKSLAELRGKPVLIEFWGTH